MSSYFDGLMRSGGLSVGMSPVLRPAPQPPGPVTEVESLVPAAPPQISPAAVDTRVAPVAVSAQETQQVKSISLPLPTPITQQATGPNALNAMSPFPDGQHDPPITFEQQAQPVSLHDGAPVQESTSMRERVVRAAFHWIAAAPPETPAKPPPEPDAETAPVLADATFAAPEASSPSTEIPESLHFPASASARSAAVELPKVQRPAAVSPQFPQAATLLRQQEPPQIREERVEVSIGAIHLRVEAPSPPAVQTLPPPRPAPSTPAKPHSGLSRRALRRI